MDEYYMECYNDMYNRDDDDDDDVYLNLPYIIPETSCSNALEGLLHHGC